MSVTLSQVLCLIAAVITVINSLAVIGRMSFSTDHLIRSAYVLVSIGSFGEVVAILNNHVPGVWETLVVVGLGAMAVSDRRCSALHSRRELHKDDSSRKVVT